MNVYTDDQKRAAWSVALAVGAARVSKSRGIPRSTLDGWLWRHQEDGCTWREVDHQPGPSPWAVHGCAECVFCGAFRCERDQHRGLAG